MELIRFVIALWASKLLLFLFKLCNNSKDDKPGYLAIKICPNFLNYVKKPNLVIAVTGTNGKTTTTNLLAEMLIKSGKKVLYNDWGANLPSSSIRCLLDGVNIFNKRKKIDVAILETDEISSKEFFPKVHPKYLIVTNLFRDSIHRNAHSEFVFNRINDALEKDMVLILNADDPISSMLGNNNKCIYFGIDKLDTDKSYPTDLVNDLSVCPKCFTKLYYNYSRYHHIGSVYCPKCDFKSKKSDYLVTNIDYNNKNFTININGNDEKFKIINESIFNIYNELAVITLLKEMGISSNNINDYLDNLSIVKSRQSITKVNGKEIETIACKGLNSIATSRVCNYISTLKGNIAIIIVIDDTFDNKGGSESIGWIYDSDFEYLNKENIKQIVVGGVRSKDYKLRLLLARIDKNKITICKDEYKTTDFLNYKDVDKIIVLHEVYFISGAYKIKDKIVEDITKGELK